MVDKNQILLNYYRDSESKSSIARRLKISRKTVREYIEEHEKLFGKELSKDLLASGITIKPEYDISGRKPRKLSDTIVKKIEECLSTNKKRSGSGLGKQQMKKIDIYELLQTEGYVIEVSEFV